MTIHRVIEVIFTLVILLFLSTLVLGVLVGITLVQELADYEMSFKIQVLFIGGMFALFLYIAKMIVDKIRQFYRYI